MIHYQLRCACTQEFDGWFNGSAGFEAQAAAGLVSCPACGGVEIHRALMAPRVAAKANRAIAVAKMREPPASRTPVAGGPMPDAVRAALTKLRAEVETHCDYVGPEFAAEARRIHNGEAEPRGIYGESTPAQAEALADDGIEIAQIPWLPRADS